MSSSHADTIRELERLEAEVERLKAHKITLMRKVAKSRAENTQLRAALEQIATGRRPDGTYNLSRKACEQIAREALDG